MATYLMEELYKEHLGLANYYAWQYNGYVNKAGALEYDDLMAVAKNALYEVCRKFDPDRGVDFKYLAAISMKYAMRNFLLKNNFTVKIPTSLIKAKSKIDKILENQDISYNDLEEHGVTKSELEFYKHNTVTENLEFGVDEIEITDNEIADNEYIEEKIHKLKEQISNLNPTEQYIINSIYGIDCKRKKQIELAQELGCTKGAVSNRYHIIMHKLKQMLIK